jgi:hypothetical protein
MLASDRLFDIKSVLVVLRNEGAYMISSEVSGANQLGTYVLPFLLLPVPLPVVALGFPFASAFAPFITFIPAT